MGYVLLMRAPLKIIGIVVLGIKIDVINTVSPLFSWNKSPGH
jgi:hypothetical protein